ncbi:MAG: hypothetical protein ACE5K7_08210, partial [Phycisphaerae bacterium]
MSIGSGSSLPSGGTATGHSEQRRAGLARALGSAVVPWSISMAIHAAVFAVLVSLTWTIGRSEQAVIVPEARLASKPGSPIRIGPTRPRLKLPSRQEQPQYRPVKQELTMSWPGRSRVRSDLKIIGIGAGGSGPLVGSGLTVAEAGPRSGFFGSGGNAYRICYVIDCSGSMLDSFDYVRRELKNSIRQLVAEQYFHVIFFSAGPPTESPPGRMVRATPEQKKRAFAFLDSVVPGGRTDPAPALERAFS